MPHSPPRLAPRRLASLLLALFAFNAFASVVAFETLEAMARRVPVIVRGRVTRSAANWEDGKRRIWTWTELMVTETVKGPRQSVILVKQPGGEVDGIGQAVEGAARFKESEDCLLFLEPAPDEPGTYRVSGLSAGKILFTQWLGQSAALRSTEGLSFAVPGQGQVAKVQQPELLGSPEALLTRVRAAIAQGAGR